jgi:hypothetical protein
VANCVFIDLLSYPAITLLLEKFVDFPTAAKASLFFWKMASIMEIANLIATCILNVD